MLSMEFRTDRGTQQRKEQLYCKNQNLPHRRRVRLAAVTGYVVCAFMGLVSSSKWDNIYIWGKDSDRTSAYMLLMALCVGGCVISLLIFFNSYGMLRMRFPGLKFDYDGPSQPTMYRIDMAQDTLTVTKNGAATVYSRRDLKHVYMDKKGILLADMDVYIPMEIVEKGMRRRVKKWFAGSEKGGAVGK